MTTNIFRALVAVLALYGLLVSASLGHSASLRAFSLREANRQAAEGRASNAELATLGGITRVAGMVFDRETGDVILIGRARSDMPPASLDDLVVALRSRLLKGQFPKVSIDMVEDTPKTGMQDVRFEGGIEKTRFGSDFLDSDVVLKRYSLDLLRRVQGVEPYLKLYEAASRQEMAKQGHPVEQVHWLSEEESPKTIERYVGKAASESKTVQSRFWYYVKDNESFIVERDDVYAIEELQLGVKAETTLCRTSDSSTEDAKEARDQVGEAFAKQFSDHFWEVSEEQPAVRRLKVLFDLVCIAEGIAHLGKGQPKLDHLLHDYHVEALDTPEKYRLVQRVGEFRGKDDLAQLVQLSGGIDLEAILLALEDGDVSALKMAVLASRPAKNALCWELPLDEWKMPNDQPSPKPTGPAMPGTTEKVRPKRLGFALTVQRFLFDPKRPDGSAPRFRGFAPPPPVKPGGGVQPTFNKLQQLTPKQPTRFVLPTPLPGPVLQDGTTIRWNLRMAETPEHTGRMLILPRGQLHEGPGSSRAGAPAYHWHPLDRRTDIYALIAIPFDKELQPVGSLPDVVPDTSLQEPVPSRIDLPLQEAVVSGNWQKVIDVVTANPDAILWPVPRLLPAHAYLALNRNNEAVTLFASVTQKPGLAAYETWTRELVRRYPDNTAAHYFRGDAFARLQRWSEAEAEFNSAITMDPPWLPKSARALVYAARAVQEKAIDRKAADKLRDQAFTDLTELTITAPEVADVHANLGAVAVELLRAAPGAERAYQRAIQVNRDFALALNGLGCAYYGLGDWDRARTQFEQAVQYPDPTLFRMAGDNHLALLTEQAEFYVSTNQLPGRPDIPAAKMQRVEPSRPDVAVAGSQSGREGSIRRPVAQYRRSVPAHQPWSQTYQSYQHQVDMMRQQMEVRRTQWEIQMRQRYHDIGGITMNMQKALADRGDWPVGTFLTLGYEVFPPRNAPSVQPAQQGSDVHRQKGDFASALAELQKTGKPLIVDVVSETAALQVGEQSGAAVHRGDRLHITRVNENWLWVESVGGRQLADPGWINQEHVR